MNAARILEASNVAWHVGSETILDHVSLALHEGEILTVIGPNGAGKTSLLRILMGLLAPGAGSVWRKPGLRIGYMPQRLVIDPSLPLDVPVQGVDVNGQAELCGLINEVRRRHNCAVLMISHDLHLVMAATDTVLCLNKHVCCAGKPEVVSAHPEFLQLFGKQAVNEIAVYTHHHDHAHDLHGHIVGRIPHG